MLYANDTVGYDRRRSGLPSAPLDMEYGNNITEESTAIAIAPNIQHIHIPALVVPSVDA